MPCTIIAHTRLEDAVAVLAADLARDQGRDPLAVRTILVQGGAVGRWLSSELARRSPHGVAAGLDLRPVGRFCRELVRPPGGRDPYTLESLIWTVDAALLDRAWLESAMPDAGLRAAVAALDRAGVHAMAAHLAGLLDRYQLERPEWIALWGRGLEVPEAVEQPWLGALWARVRERSGGVEPLSLRLERLIARLRPGRPPPGCPADLWLLAPTALPPLLVRLLAALGDRAGVALRILHLVPARHDSLWTALDNEGGEFDPDTTPLGRRLAGAHPLLAACARQAHDLAVQLAESADGGQRQIDLDGIWARPAQPEAPLLAQLQAQVWSASGGALVLRPGDRSLGVHRCHSPLREAEALRDALVGLLAAPDAPRPDEVLVAVTDLERYAPLLRAVLGGRRGDGVALPVQVVGQAASADPLVAALLAVLALPTGNATLAEVLAPLEAPAIRRRFALDEDDLALLQHRLLAAGVSWGLDEEQRRRVGGHDAAEGTWLLGVHRLLLGLASGPQARLLPDLLPAGAALTGDDAAVGGIAVYLDVLRRFAAAVADGPQARLLPMAAWRRLLFALVADLAEPDHGREAEAVGLVRGAIAAIPLDAAELDLATIRKHLQRMLADEGAASTWMRGGVTVAPLAALRHAPHAIIAVLGLDGGFPRVAPPSVFDAAARRRRRGDRNQRLDDRQAFLDLLLGARRALHLSWTGFALEDGSPREASSAVEDLLRLLDRDLHGADGARLDRAAVLTVHRLHASDPAYFDGTLPRSHDTLACRAARARAERDAGAEAPAVPCFLDADATVPAPAQLAPEAAAAWLVDPARAFAHEVLGLRFAGQQDLPGHEPLDLDPLAAWQLRQRALGEDGGGDELRLRQDGLLPHGAPGTMAARIAAEEAAGIAARLDAALAACAAAAPTLPLGIDLALPGAEAPRRIAGPLPHCDGRVLVRRHAGALKGPQLLEAWVLHQLANAAARQAGRPGFTTLLAGRERERSRSRPWRTGSCRFVPASASEADWLAIVAALRACRRRPLPFFPDLAEQVWDARSQGVKDWELRRHLAAWRDGGDEDGRLRSELGMPAAWTRLVWRGDADPTAGWEESFLVPLWQPLVRAAQAGAEGGA